MLKIISSVRNRISNNSRTWPTARNIGFACTLLLLVCVLIVPLKSTLALDTFEDFRFHPDRNGNIRHWLVAGPFEQPVILFEGISDADSIGETKIAPHEGMITSGAMTANKQAAWLLQSSDDQGYLDLHPSLSAYDPGRNPEKIHQAFAGYACVYLHSEQEREVYLLSGSNSRSRVWLNDQLIFKADRQRVARQDEDTLRLALRAGRNRLLLKIGNSHLNYYMPFWGGIDWGWGFYARIVDKEMHPVDDLQLSLPLLQTGSTVEAASTIFFKKIDGQLLQQIEVRINSRHQQPVRGRLGLDIGGEAFNFDLGMLSLGINRKLIEIPALTRDVRARLELSLPDGQVTGQALLKKQAYFKLHLMMLSHMDIGYTHPQPVASERHLRTLDDVLAQCRQDTAFRWTIETMRIVDEYRQFRPAGKFEQLLQLIRSGRIAVSPLYSNPFTGWIDEGELLHSFSLAEQYRRKFGIDFSGAVYNDTPGLNQALPQVLSDFGIKMLVCGINEIYGGYKLQMTLPKVFAWQGSGGATVPVYRCEAYTEGRTYGLENLAAMRNRIAQRIKKLKAFGYPYDLILLDASLTDNAGIPFVQYKNALAWNREYAYPKILISNLNDFSRAFTKKYDRNLPQLAGDWTSDWDILNQGEPQRMQMHRKTQNLLNTAERLSALANLLGPQRGYLQNQVDTGYLSLLSFSGHGSGLEFGFGSPEDNDITSEFRESYLQQAHAQAEEVLLRAVHRLAVDQETLADEGLMVFNSLSWKRDVPVRFEFSEQNLKQYQLIDALTGRVVPSFRDGYRLFFIARDLPSLGYRKFRLKPVARRSDRESSDLIATEGVMENRYFRVTFDPDRSSVESITDKTTGRIILKSTPERPLAKLLMKKLFQPEFNVLKETGGSIDLIDQRPIRLILRLSQPADILQKIEFVLWNDLNRLDVTADINSGLLQPPQQAEEYALAFPFKISDGQFRVELLGGLINPLTGRLPVSGHNAFSIRRAAAFFNDSESVLFASPDVRVLRIESSSGTPAILVNVLNNFPPDWNRREKNEGLLQQRFSLAAGTGPFRPEYAVRFGWERAVECPVRYSLFKDKPAQMSFLQIDNPALCLVTLKTDLPGKSWRLIVQNSDPENSQSGLLHFNLAGDFLVEQVDLAGRAGRKFKLRDNALPLRLDGGQIRTYRLTND